MHCGGLKLSLGVPLVVSDLVHLQHLHLYGEVEGPVMQQPEEEEPLMNHLSVRARCGRSELLSAGVNSEVGRVVA